MISLRNKVVVLACLLTLVNLLAIPTNGQNPAQLVKDIAPGTSLGANFFGPAVDVNGVAIGFGRDPVNGLELWRSDGTVAGTYLIKDICPGPCSSLPIGISRLAKLGNAVYFNANDGSTGFELWRTDGTTAGTMLVKDATPGPNPTYPYDLTVAANRLFFRYGGYGTPGLWTSDGTAAGTIEVWSGAESPSGLTDGGNVLFFVSRNEIWKSNGTPTGTALVASLPTGTTFCSLLTPIGTQLLFCALDSQNGKELWRAEVTSGTVSLVSDINPGSASSNPTLLIAFGGNVYFAANNGSSGIELWRSDGTNTIQWMDINPGPPSSLPGPFLVVGSDLFFVADDGLSGRELWKTDGTAAGTWRIQDLRPGLPSSNPDSLTQFAGKLFFKANDGLHGSELWTTDGTQNTALQLTDLNAGPGDSQVGFIVVLPSFFLFSAFDGTNYGLWKSDGTIPGTQLVTLGSPLNNSSDPWNFTGVSGTMFFVTGVDLWKTDGTPASTALVLAGAPNSSAPTFLTELDGKLYFVFEDGINGAELWRSDGTPQGTSLVKDINPGPASSQISWIEKINNKLVFSASDGISGFEIWSSDGTALGTLQLGDICPGACPFNSFRQRIVYSNRVFFEADDGIHGVELWQTDGTPSGTSLFADLTPGPANSQIRNFAIAGGMLYFTADTNGPPYSVIWKSDGITAAPVDLSPPYEAPDMLFAANGLLLFFAFEPNTGYELWRSDGTPAGTYLLKDFVPGPGEPLFRSPDFEDSSEFSDLKSSFVSTGKLAYFTLHDGQNGFELWKSDGTPAGTVLVKDIVPGVQGSFPHGLSVVDGVLVFEATDQVHGTELWRSDGTPSGTFMVQDITPGPGSSFSRPLGGYSFFASGTKMYFAADDGTTGVEPWVMDVASIQVNTPLGQTVSAEPVDASTGTSPVEITFSSVVSAGITTLSTTTTAPPPPVGFSLGSPATYYEITTTAQFSAPVTICIHYGSVSYTDEAQLKLFHLENSIWVDRTTSQDLVNDVICGEVTSFSPFIVVERVNQPPVASISTPALVMVREPAAFSGQASFDPDGSIVGFDWTFSDGGSASGLVVSHAFTTAGSYVIALTITDDRGAPASTFRNIHVNSESETISHLASLVASFNLQQGIANSLDAKLQNALDALNAAKAGNRQDATNKLQSFINAVEAQRGKELTTTQADQLIQLATRIIAVL